MKPIIVKGSKIQDSEKITTGIYALDVELNGGIKKGSVNHIYGHTSSGKTLLSLVMIREYQKRGLKCLFVPVEVGSYDKEWFSKFVDVDALDVFIAETSEEIVDGVVELVKNNAYDMIVVDSIAALVPSVIIEDPISSKHIGNQSLMITVFFSKLNKYMLQLRANGKVPPTVILLNQTRKQITNFGAFDIPTGGEALKFYTMNNIQLKRKEYIKYKNSFGDVHTVGMVSQFVILKQKNNSESDRAGEFSIFFEDVPEWNVTDRVDNVKQMLSYAVRYGIIDKRGSIYEFKDKTWRGKDNMAIAVKQDKELLKQIAEEVAKYTKVMLEV